MSVRSPRRVAGWTLAGLALAVLGLAARAADLPPVKAPGGQGTYLILTDIHFDPFESPQLVKRLDAAPIEEWRNILDRHAGQAVAGLGSDSNYALLRSALAASAAQGLHDYVLVGGDLLSHDFEANAQPILGSVRRARAFATKTTIFVARQIEAAFPDLPVIPAIGNNDGSCGDYGIEPASAYLERLARTWRIFAADKGAAHAYAKFGSYALAHPTVRKHRLLVVNDVYLSTDYVDGCAPGDPDPGVATLDWLEGQLFTAADKGEQATLLFHIPPGYDGYGSASKGQACTVAVPFWQPQYAAHFQQLAQDYRKVIAGAVAAHLHTDGFRVFGAATDRPFLPIHTAPSVSPVYYNNPAFTVVTYDRTDGRNLDFLVHFLQVGTSPPADRWRLEYSFGSEYGFGEVDGRTLAALSRKIGPDGPLAGAFKKNFQVRARQTIDAALWKSYLCAQTAMTQSQFVDCRCAD